MSIELKNVTKLYDLQRAASNVSFQIRPGEIVGFLGPNGAGKSTTMKIITGYATATKGEVYINGINVHKKPMDVKRNLGYLPEGNPLYIDMYVREYLQFVCRIFGIENKEKRIEKLLDLVEVTGKEASKKIGQLSKGYKQRVGLAGSLVHDPKVLILDEATSGLDPNQAISFRRLIREIAKEKTVLFSSHILADVEALCKRIIVIHKGNIVADDVLSKLKQKTIGKTPITVVQHTPNQAINLLSKHLSDIRIEHITPDKIYIYATLNNNLNKKINDFFLKKNIQLVSISQKSTDVEELFQALTATTQQA